MADGQRLGIYGGEARTFAFDIGLKPLTTPVCSPQSNASAESFVKKDEA
jgi:putative transposase